MSVFDSPPETEHAFYATAVDIGVDRVEADAVLDRAVWAIRDGLDDESDPYLLAKRWLYEQHWPSTVGLIPPS
ncbi:MAG: hypothetical protein ACRDQ5_01690 [Sciscionella sp.]